MPARPILFMLCPLLLVVAGAAGAATTAQTLGIKLQDPSTDSSIAHMRIVLDQNTIKPGRVILQAENQSKNLVHEVIIGLDSGAEQLPMDAKHDRVIESRVRRLGEIADLAPGKSGKLSLNLKPGNYVLFCNQPGHYHDGMVTRLTVAP
jgi:uncharacterized cupredoxin-like copper-binding protein